VNTEAAAVSAYKGPLFAALFLLTVRHNERGNKNIKNAGNGESINKQDDSK
jgi:hypothetical protein